MLKFYGLVRQRAFMAHRLCRRLVDGTRSDAKSETCRPNPRNLSQSKTIEVLSSL